MASWTLLVFEVTKILTIEDIFAIKLITAVTMDIFLEIHILFMVKLEQIEPRHIIRSGLLARRSTGPKTTKDKVNLFFQR